MNTQNPLATPAKLLLTCLLIDPKRFAGQLLKLHNLALYESGGALLGEDEKDALFNIYQLADALERLDEEAIDSLRSLL